MQEECQINVLNKIYFNLILFCLNNLIKSLIKKCFIENFFFKYVKKYFLEECDTKSLGNKLYLHNIFNKSYLLIF